MGLTSGASISTFAEIGPSPPREGASSEDTEALREGRISILSDDRVVLADGSVITASVGTGLGGSVEIRDPKAVVLRDGSAILATTETGEGGSITISADAFAATPDSQVSADAGVGTPGVVRISSPDVDLESQATPLDTSFLEATAQLRPSCGARAAGGASGSFTVARHRGLRSSPEGLLLAFDDLGAAGAGEGVAAEDDDELPAVAAAPAPGPSDSPAPVLVAQASVDEAASAFRGGHFEAAEERLSRASEIYAKAGDENRRAEALRGLGESQQAQGRYAESLVSLSAALEAARASGNARRTASTLGSLGNAYLALGEVELARDHLSRSVDLAKQAGDPALASRLLNNLGNLRASQHEYAAALRAYEQSADLAKETGDATAEARALTSAGRAALEAGETERARDLLAGAKRRGATLALSYDKAAIAIHLGTSWARLAELSPADRDASLLAAFEALRGAVETASELQEPLVLSYALGNLGALYESEGRTEEGLYLTRQALQAAQQADAPDSLYRWHWQEGRLLWAEGHASAALASYRRAVEILEELRPETRAQYGSAELRFRRAVAPVYLDFVDALMQGSGMVEQRPASTRLLLEARAVMEQLKAAELRDYFRDECVAEIESRTRSLEEVAARAAVVYPILLPDRLELLVSLPSGIERHTVPVSSSRVAEEVTAFRQGLVKRTTYGFRPHAEQLHAWLVAPYAERLKQEKIQTLVFVPDGPLRTIPMAALHDGERYLIQRHAVAVTPGLSLVDPRPLDPEQAQLLLAGLSEATQGFPEIPYAAQEVEAIQALYGGQVLLDEGFQAERFEGELASREPNVVHVASHAVFTGDLATSFLLTHDDRLTMEGLSEVVAPTQYRTRPLELLALSACETAAGDERAALGLAGVAIRAGARSALGSLWRVNDPASYRLMVAFYEELKDPAVSKAEALQRAQLRLLQEPGFAHPFYWSPFLLISNWL